MGRARVAARVIVHPGVEDLSVQQVLEALADPARRSVVRRLAHAGAALSCGSFDLPVSRSTSTHHFNVLRQAGLLHQYYVGTTKMNSLRAEELEGRFPGLLSAVVAAADAEARTAP
ncbi:helix-turn-helix transcriptional regulator [Kitasatospora sp. NPDC094016]|uniref:ArsR/SmtB family transcription factor n=1 Tax=unclassified Kitasatospora TaxID=2633591 RepID=UPI003321D8CF|nr:helix-turn-helix domain-containing protein [Kitasatospora sp. NBC_01300]WSK08248.1 helix-turn-helix domain-containing protein [Kitasatospora sp. NBC_01300]